MQKLSRRALFGVGLSAGATALASSSTARGPGPDPGPAPDASAGKPATTAGSPAHHRVGLHHAAVRTRDWDRTLAFYREVLGCHVKLAWQETLGNMDDRLAQVLPPTQRWAYLDCGDGSCVEVFEDSKYVAPAVGTSDPTGNPGGPLVHMGFRTTRIEEMFEIAGRHGIKTLGPPADFTLHTTSGQGPVVVRLCFLQGPSGEWIELIQGLK